MHRRFTTASLERALATAGLRATRVGTVPGPIPIGFVAMEVMEISYGAAPAGGWRAAVAVKTSRGS